MIPNFTPAQREVHYPDDRRRFIGLKSYIIAAILAIIIIPLGAAWIQYLIYGLPPDPSLALPEITPDDPVGFPTWVNVSHWVNFFFLTLLIRSGLSVLADHPRLYWNNGCSPETEWARFTPIKIPKKKVWTAKEDARYISPIISLPGYKHTIGLARIWHFLTVPFFVLNGVIFMFLLFYTDHWQRVVPTSWSIIPDAWNIFVHYATFNMPIEPNGFFHYNALQKISYFGVIFILAPLAIMTGTAMSPAVVNRFPWYPKLFGNRQSARSIHFLILIAYTVFIIIHVAMVAATGLVRNMNHITLGIDDATTYTGLFIGIAILLFTACFWVLAHWLSWHKPRRLQKIQLGLNGRLWSASINQFKPKKYYSKEDISPYFWPNGKMPESEEWKKLAENDFKDYKLKIGGLVENPVELSLEDLKELAKEEHITMHHCIQGWSGIAQWGGIPIKKIVELVKPYKSVTTVAFYSFGEGLYGGVYYDTHTLDNCMKPQSILAWEMNYKKLPLIYGAPLRLRVENQLGYKLVKWIEHIEFVETHKTIGKGYGGKNEDDEYFDLIAST
ncbi:MAG TPA: molybdopterin-dependent oxidoreductase [Flavobacteriaceae bacterium]|nr:molybdopterin-dependent oxidoreductase [Flavobacteriaceae bacterium]